jgi:SAM-dependent methyltransferase
MDERNFETKAATSSRDVLSFYDAYASTWDSRFGDSPANVHFHATRLNSLLTLARFAPSDTAVELGVGTGPYLSAIAPKVARLIAIDGSIGMLDVLRRKHAHLANVEVLQRDLEQSSAAVDFQADIVYWFGLLEHIIDVPAFLSNCRRMLKPGGRIVLVAPNGRCPWYGALRRIWRAGAHCSTDRYYTPGQCDGLMARHGFVRDRLVYWGYAPAGVSRWLYLLLTSLGRLADATPLRRYAGGMTIRYLLDPVDGYRG